MQEQLEMITQGFFFITWNLLDMVFYSQQVYSTFVSHNTVLQEIMSCKVYKELSLFR